MATIGVINAGGWGTALAVLLAHHGHGVRLWCRREALADEINTTRRNSTYLPDVAIPDAVHATVGVEEALDGAELVVIEGGPHAVNASHADQFNRALLAFLAR